MKLLIVEDNIRMREMLKELFSSKFAEIILCDDGSKALSAYKKNKPDWVFMDIKMKGMNGITATNEITDKFPDAKILMVTDFDNNDFRKEAFNNGAKDYVLKENLEDIFNIIK